VREQQDEHDHDDVRAGAAGKRDAGEPRHCVDDERRPFEPRRAVDRSRPRSGRRDLVRARSSGPYFFGGGAGGFGPGVGGFGAGG
jgi:hypothetical protein